MNNIYIINRPGFHTGHPDSSLFQDYDYSTPPTPFTLRSDFDGKTDYEIYASKKEEIEKYLDYIIKQNQKNISVKVVVSNPCIHCAIVYPKDTIKSVELDYFVSLYNKLQSLKKLFNSKVQIFKFEQLENDDHDYNKYIQKHELEYFNKDRYLQLIDLCRYLPKEENPMKLFSYGEIPLSKILQKD